MTAADVTDAFIERMRVIFGDPPGDNPAAAFKVYIRPLSRHNADVLEQVADHYLLTSKRRTWPMPADVAEVADRISAKAEALARAREASRRSAPPPVDQLVHDALFSDIGLAAAREGWITFLHDFVLKHERHPSEAEIATLKQDAARHYRRVEEEIANGEGFMVRTTAETILARRRNMVERVQEWARARQPDAPVG